MWCSVQKWLSYRERGWSWSDQSFPREPMPERNGCPTAPAGWADNHAGHRLTSKTGPGLSACCGAAPAAGPGGRSGSGATFRRPGRVGRMSVRKLVSYSRATANAHLPVARPPSTAVATDFLQLATPGGCSNTTGSTRPSSARRRIVRLVGRHVRSISSIHRSYEESVLQLRHICSEIPPGLRRRSGGAYRIAEAVSVERCRRRLLTVRRWQSVPSRPLVPVSLGGRELRGGGRSVW